MMYEVKDSQVTELLGRNRLVDELLRARLEVAFPARDRGIDLIAYTDLDSDLKRYVACPIQMKASSHEAFSIDRKYEKFPGLVIAYVWGLAGKCDACTYALTYKEAIEVADKMGWTETNSWKGERGYYSTSQPSKVLKEKYLEQYKMTPEKWYLKVTQFASNFAPYSRESSP
jgi:hypothetical protein